MSQISAYAPFTSLIGDRPRRVERPHRSTPDPRFASMRALIDHRAAQIRKARAQDEVLLVEPSDDSTGHDIVTN